MLLILTHVNCEWDDFVQVRRVTEARSQQKLGLWMQQTMHWGKNESFNFNSLPLFPILALCSLVSGCLEFINIMLDNDSK